MKKTFTPKKILIFSLVLSVALIISIFVSYNRLREAYRAEQPVVVTDTGLNPNASPAVTGTVVVPGALVETSPGKPLPDSDDAAKPFVNLRAPVFDPNCKESSEYSSLHEKLGVLVNRTYDKKSKPNEFAKLVDDFRIKNGIPLPLGVAVTRLKKDGVVYDNCRTICRGAVNQVFISRLTGKRFAEVMSARGEFAQLPLHESGLEIATIDELSQKGLPFRSWLAPMTDGPWYLKDNDIYYKLDIRELALKISPMGDWRVVASPQDLVRLDSVDPVTVRGCTRDEQCLVAGKRHFKTPYVCPSVVSHAADEPSEKTRIEGSPIP